jgi:hypothetical protein
MSVPAAFGFGVGVACGNWPLASLYASPQFMTKAVTARTSSSRSGPPKRLLNVGIRLALPSDA